MDNSTLAIVGTVVLGLIGVAYFVLMQEPATKKKSAKGGLKPREDLYTQ